MRAGDVVWNPLTGEKAMLVDTAGDRLVADFAVEAGGFVPGGEHVHDHCAEHLAVQSGRITFVLDGSERTLGPYRDEIRNRRPPDVVQRHVFPALAAIARRRGAVRTLARYLDPAAHPSAEPGLGRLPERVMR